MGKIIQNGITYAGSPSATPATTTEDGLMSATDKVKLDGVDSGANNYSHPETHPSTMITGLGTASALNYSWDASTGALTFTVPS